MRSIALAEDTSEAFFAGQQDTYLWNGESLTDGKNTTSGVEIIHTLPVTLTDNNENLNGIDWGCATIPSSSPNLQPASLPQTGPPATDTSSAASDEAA